MIKAKDVLIWLGLLAAGVGIGFLATRPEAERLKAQVNNCTQGLYSFEQRVGTQSRYIIQQEQMNAYLKGQLSQLRQVQHESQKMGDTNTITTQVPQTPAIPNLPYL